MQQYGFWFSGMVTGTAHRDGMEERTGSDHGPRAYLGDKGKRISTTITATGYVTAKITKNPDAMWDAFEWLAPASRP